MMTGSRRAGESTRESGGGESKGHAERSGEEGGLIDALLESLLESCNESCNTACKESSRGGRGGTPRGWSSPPPRGVHQHTHG